MRRRPPRTLHAARYTLHVLAFLPLFHRPRPIVLEQPRERTVGQQLSVRLTARAVVRLVLRVANTLDGRAARGAGLTVPPVYGHAFTKRRHLLREAALVLVAQALRPFDEGRARRIEETLPCAIVEHSRLHQRRQPRAMQDLIGVRIADAAQDRGIGQRAFERVVARLHAFPKYLEIVIEHFQSAALELMERTLPLYDVQRRAPLRPRFRQGEHAVRELEVKQRGSDTLRTFALVPMESAGDHEVQHHPGIALVADRDSFAQAA